MCVAVIGVGHLGRHHARILAAVPDVDLVGVVDTNLQRAREIAEAHGTAAIDDGTTLVGAVDAVVVATPTASHRAVALPFLEAGTAVLIEKPLARTLPEADEIIAAAARSGATLAVGHTERFNPAFVAARSRLTAPRFIEGHRLGTFPDRSLDIDVVLATVDSPVSAIDAVGVPVLTPRFDIANVRLRFENGCICNLTASRISRDRTRKIRFFQPESYVAIDFAAQELEMWRLVRPPAGMPAIEGGPVAVERGEPLARELEDFLAAVREGRPATVTGAAGRQALELAQRITEQMTSVR